MDEQDGFYQLIPRGEDFYRRPKSSGKEPEEEPADASKGILYIEQCENRLLSAFGYQNRHQSDLEQVLYVKPLFILNNAFPKKGDAQRRALNLLVADQDLLFKEGDRYYQSKRLNQEVISAQKQMGRDLRSQRNLDDNNDLIISTIKDCEHAPDSCLEIRAIKLGRDRAEQLLPIFLTALKKKKLSAYRWLYSKQHLGITERNKLQYYSHYLFYQGGGYIDKEDAQTLSKLERLNWREQSARIDALQRLPSDQEKGEDWKRFIDSVLAQKNTPHTWLLDPDACVRSVRKILLDEQVKRDFPCPDAVFFHFFIEEYLTRYIQLEARQREQVPEGQVYYDRQRVAAGISGFQRRFQKIETLREMCDKMPVPNEPKECEFSSWGLTERFHSDEEVRLYRKLSCAIQLFFRRTANPLCISSPAEENDLLQRIAWCMNFSEFEPYELYQKPLQLLKMIYACGKYITTDRDVYFCCTQSARSYPKEQVSKAGQHYAELMFLRCVHALLKLDDTVSAQSWHWYFQWRGKLFYPETETLFWKRFLDGAYEKVPDVGLLLCFLEYRDSCLNPHVDELSYYSAAGKTCRGGFSQFYQEHVQEVHSLIAMLDDHRDAAAVYMKLWGSPNRSYHSRLSALKKIWPYFAGNPTIKAFPKMKKEYQYLLLETAIRIWTCNQAKEKLLTWFCDLYGWKWKE